jgi:hypothetical protein
MLYSAIRSTIAILLVTPLLASKKVTGVFKHRLSLFLAYIGVITAVSILLTFWPFENYFGGFDSVEQAMEYEHGQVTIQDTIETETSVFVYSDKTIDLLFKDNGHYYLNISWNLSRKIGLGPGRYYVTIFKDKHDLQNYVQFTIFEFDKVPKLITDNKGSKIEERFTDNGLIYFLGSFAYDDGTPYKIYVDGKDIELQMRD